MSDNHHDIEWIVAEVMRRLEQLANRPSREPPQSVAPATRAVKTETKQAGKRNDLDLVVTERVVALQTIGGRLAGKKRLVVRPHAVVTPSVRDELRKRGVKLERTTEPEVTVVSQAEPLVLIGCRSPAAERLASQAALSGCETTECVDWQAAATLVGQHLREPHATAIWISSAPLLAQTLANRDVQVRACVVHSLTEVQAAMAAIGANLMVVDPGRVTEFQWKQIIAELGREATGQCPAVLKPKVTDKLERGSSPA
jgi:hypothetical protein